MVKFLSWAGEDVAEDDSQVAAIRVDAVGSAAIRVDAAENGPSKVGVPGGCFRRPKHGGGARR